MQKLLQTQRALWRRQQKGVWHEERERGGQQVARAALWQWHHNRLTDKHTNALAIKHTHLHTHTHMAHSHMHIHTLQFICILTHALTHTHMHSSLQSLSLCKSCCSIALSRSLSLALLSLQQQKSSSFCFCAKCRKKLDLDYLLCEWANATERERERGSTRVRKKFKLNVVVASRPSRCSQSTLFCYCSLPLTLSLCQMMGRHNLHCLLLLFLLLLCFLWGSHAFCYCWAFAVHNSRVFATKTLRGHWKLIEFCISYNENDRREWQEGMGTGTREGEAQNKRCILCSHMFTCSIFVLQFYCFSVNNQRCRDVCAVMKWERGGLRAAHIMQLYNMIFVLFIVLDLNEFIVGFVSWWSLNYWGYFCI